ncbi:MAG TPA: Hpt domain-containing protein [Pirellulales bacterium]|jgi:HPt (histidine-containing phosphotransfer) domain-containing protein|nr:Hpt domain-containing protein [Pirellulales bacterium]
MRLPDRAILPATPTAPAAAPLNLDELTQRCLGSIALVERLLASFVQRFPIELAEIAECLGASDVPRLARCAHQLKGAAANLSAPALRSTLELVEHAAKAGELAPIAGYLDQLQLQWECFCQYRLAVAAPGGRNVSPAGGPSPAPLSAEDRP